MSNKTRSGLAPFFYGSSLTLCLCLGAFSWLLFNGQLFTEQSVRGITYISSPAPQAQQVVLRQPENMHDLLEGYQGGQP